MATVHIPSLLRPHTGGQERVVVSGRTLRQVINALDDAHPGLKERLLLDEDRLRPEIVAAIDGETEHLGLIEPVREDAEIHFIPAVSGGTAPSELHMLELTTITWNEEGAFVVLCPELDIVSQGDSPEHAQEMIREALELFFEVADEEEIARRWHEDFAVSRLTIDVPAELLPHG